MKTNGILSKIEGLKVFTEELERQNLVRSNNNSFSKQSAELDLLKEKLFEKKFYLVVIGLFKRGKSSLVNALVKKEVVPQSVVPLTSIVTMIEYGEDNLAKIFFYDGRVEISDVEAIPEYVTETVNPLKKNVNYVNVLLNSELLKKVTLVDTPGVGSTFENNTETTYSFIERIDAALFILSADLPISKTEVEFLAKLKSTVPKFIFVLNKIDLISVKETEKIISFNKTVLGKIFGVESIKILPVSAKLAVDGVLHNEQELVTESGLYELVQEIESMLSKDKHDVIMASAKNQFNSHINKTEMMLNIQLKALLMPIDKLNKNYEEFLSSMAIMKKDKGDYEILINGKVKQLQEYVTSTLYGFAETLYNNFCDNVEKNTAGFYGKLKSEGVDLVYKEYFKKIEQSYEPLKLNLEKEIVEKFHNILIEYSQGSNRFLNEFVKNFSVDSLFEFEELVEVFDLKIITVFYFQYDKSYNSFYLSNRFLRNWALTLAMTKILKRLKENVKRNIDMNTGRVNYDINYKIQESFRKFNLLLNEKLDETLNMLDGIISDTIKNKSKTEDMISGQIKYISEGLEKLNLFKMEN